MEQSCINGDFDGFVWDFAEPTLQKPEIPFRVDFGAQKPAQNISEWYLEQQRDDLLEILFAEIGAISKRNDNLAIFCLTCLQVTEI